MKINLIIAALLIVTTSVLGACTFGLSDNESVSAYTYVSMDINPSIDFIVNNDDQVEDVIANNEDAEVLLYEIRENILGNKIDDVASSIVEEAIMLGYISHESDFDNPATVVLSVLSDNNSHLRESDLFDKLDKGLNDKFVENGFPGKVFAAENILDGSDYDLGEYSPGKIRMVERVVKLSEEYSEQDVEVLLEKDISEIVSKIRQSAVNISESIDNENVENARQQRRDQLGEDFEDWLDQRKNISEKVRSQIRTFQEENFEDNDMSEWAKSLRERIGEKFSGRNDSN